MGEHRVSTPAEQRQNGNGNGQGFLGGILQGLGKAWSGSRMGGGQGWLGYDEGQWAPGANIMDPGRIGIKGRLAGEGQFGQQPEMGLFGNIPELEYSSDYGKSPQDKQMGQLMRDMDMRIGGMGEPDQMGKMYADFDEFNKDRRIREDGSRPHDEDFNEGQAINAALVRPLSGYLFELQQARDSQRWGTYEGDIPGRFSRTMTDVPGKDASDEELMKIALDSVYQGYKDPTRANPRMLQKGWSGFTREGEIFDEELPDTAYDKWFSQYGYGQQEGNGQSQQPNNIMDAILKINSLKAMPR